MIDLNMIFPFLAAEQDRVRIRFLIPSNGEDPLEEYFINPSNVTFGWTLWYNVQKKLHDGDLVLSFVRITGSKWLFVAAKKVNGIYDCHHFNGVDDSRFDSYLGRLRIMYKNKSQNLVRRYKEIAGKCDCHILPDKYSGDKFPGYNRVLLSWKRLRHIVDQRPDDWVSALSNIKAVYIITDEEANKRYIGSATSDSGMLFSRWKDYAVTLHGGDVELQKLDPDYIKTHFKYSILQSFPDTVPDQEVLDREVFWKNVISTRGSNGYNVN